MEPTEIENYASMLQSSKQKDQIFMSKLLNETKIDPMLSMSKLDQSMAAVLPSDEPD